MWEIQAKYLWHLFKWSTDGAQKIEEQLREEIRKLCRGCLVSGSKRLSVLVDLSCDLILKRKVWLTSIPSHTSETGVNFLHRTRSQLWVFAIKKLRTVIVLLSVVIIPLMNYSFLPANEKMYKLCNFPKKLETLVFSKRYFLLFRLLIRTHLVLWWVSSYII